MVINRSFQSSGLQPVQDSAVVYSAESFRNAIVRERYLSDRNNHGFSLVRFDMCGSEDDKSDTCSQFIEILSTRKRDVDIIGLTGLKNKQMSVLLPDTDCAGATTFVSRIMNDAGTTATNISHTISTYPKDNWADIQSTAPVSNDAYTSITDDAYSAVIQDARIPLWKRSLDIFGSIAGIVLLLPLFAIVAIFIKIVSPGPVLYTQKRVGHLGRIFNFYKFRTMAEGNDESVHEEYLKELIKTDRTSALPMHKLENDTRIIRFGNFLRKSCIDELPQLINVLSGEMSLVGPRPCIPYEAEEYLRWHARRFDIIPGMTGLWQVSGKNKTTFKEMIRYDIKYSSTSSLWLDLYIILKTPFAIVMQAFDRQETIAKKEIKRKTTETVKRRLATEVS